MNRRAKILGSLLIALLLASLATYALDNTRLTLNMGRESGAVAVVTTTPNATCQKTFMKGFPFVKLECTPKCPESSDVALKEPVGECNEKLKPDSNRY